MTGIWLVILAALANVAFPCECGEAPGPRKALEQADLVVAGVIVGIGPVIPMKSTEGQRARGVVSSGDLMGWRVAVTEAWKGEPADTMVIYSARYGSSCGVEFRTGGKYLIYAYHWSSRNLKTFYETTTVLDSVITMTGRCSRTEDFDSASEDLEQLPEPVWTSSE